MNYVYIMPESMDLVKKRFIRERVGSETEKSLEDRIKKAELEIQRAKQADWINKVLVNDFTEKYHTKAETYIHR